MMKVGLAGSYLCSFNLFEMHNVFLHDYLEEEQQERGAEMPAATIKRVWNAK